MMVFVVVIVIVVVVFDFRVLKVIIRCSYVSFAYAEFFPRAHSKPIRTDFKCSFTKYNVLPKKYYLLELNSYSAPLLL